MILNAIPARFVSLSCHSDPVTGNGWVLQFQHKTRVQGSSYETSEENFECSWKSSARYWVENPIWEMLIYCSNSWNYNINPSRWSSSICLEKFETTFLKHLLVSISENQKLSVSVFCAQIEFFLDLTRFILLFSYINSCIRQGHKIMHFGNNNSI